MCNLLAALVTKMRFHCTQPKVVDNSINGRDVQRKNVVNNVDKSSVWAP